MKDRFGKFEAYLMESMMENEMLKKLYIESKK